MMNCSLKLNLHLFFINMLGILIIINLNSMNSIYIKKIYQHFSIIFTHILNTIKLNNFSNYYSTIELI